MEALNIRLAKEAKAKGICKAWYEKLLLTTSTRGLLKMYLAGIDFCFEKHFPDKEVLKSFGREAQKSGIYVDKADLDVQNVRTFVSLGCTKGRIECNGFKVADMYINDSSELLISLKDNAYAAIQTYGNCRIKVLTANSAAANIYNFSPSTTIDILGENIKIINKY